MVDFADPYVIVVFGFLAVTVTVGVLTYKLVQKSSRRYIIAGRTLPLFFVGTMLAAQAIDGNSSLGNVSLVYEFGFWAGAVIPLGLALCLFLTAAAFAKRLNRMNMMTLPDFYYRRYGNVTEVFAGVLMLISFTILVAGNFAASGFILSTVLDVDFFWGILISALIVLAYTYAGGLFSCAYTDIFQIYLAIIGFWAAFIFFAGGFSGIEFATILEATPEGYLDISGMTDPANGAYLNWAGLLALGIGDVVALDFMERVFAAKDPKTARRGALWGGGLTLFTVIPTSMLGIIALYMIPDIADPFTALPDLAIHHLPFWIGALILMGVIGASMSTANGGLLAVSSVWSRNLVQRNILRAALKRRGLDNRQLLRTTRFFAPPMMIAAFLLGWMLPNPGIYLILAFDVVFAGAFVPLTLGIYWKKANAAGAIAALAVGSVLRLVLFFIIPEDLAGLDTLIPPPVSLGVFVLVTMLTQKKYVPRHEVIDFVPKDEHVVEGIDLVDLGKKEGNG